MKWFAFCGDTTVDSRRNYGRLLCFACLNGVVGVAPIPTLLISGNCAAFASQKRYATFSANARAAFLVWLMNIGDELPITLIVLESAAATQFELNCDLLILRTTVRKDNILYLQYKALTEAGLFAFCEEQHSICTEKDAREVIAPLSVAGNCPICM